MAIRKPLYFDSASGTYKEISSTTDSSTVGSLTAAAGVSVLAGTVTATGQYVVNVGNPVSILDASNKVSTDATVSQTQGFVRVTGYTKTPVTIGDPVYFSASIYGTYRAAANDLTAGIRIAGVSLSTLGTSKEIQIVTKGVAAGVLQGATPGQSYWLGLNGGLVTTPPVPDPGGRAQRVFIGTAVSPTDLLVRIQDYGNTK